jgi:hypothetical protein
VNSFIQRSKPRNLLYPRAGVDAWGWNKRIIYASTYDSMVYIPINFLYERTYYLCTNVYIICIGLSCTFAYNFESDTWNIWLLYTYLSLHSLEQCTQLGNVYLFSEGSNLSRLGPGIISYFYGLGRFSRYCISYDHPVPQTWSARAGRPRVNNRQRASFRAIIKL